MILSFWTDRSRQAVQTQIRLLLSSLIRVCFVCHSICIFWTNYSKVLPLYLNFELTTAKFFCSPKGPGLIRGIFGLRFSEKVQLPILFDLYSHHKGNIP